MNSTIVDVKIQAYDRREEIAAIFLAAAISSDSFINCLHVLDPDTPAPSTVAQIQKSISMQLRLTEWARVTSAIDSDPREHSRHGKPGSLLAH
jgi:hypothetical protein